jgi:hypothetical protein
MQGAVRQICGAIRNPNHLPKWCEHPRRGRVELGALPPIIHGIALAETRHRVDLRPVTSHLPLDFSGVPITYLSLNDFLNPVVQLRTIPELLEYLNGRRSLPTSCLYIIGDEKPLFELYLMNGGNFAACTSHEDARRAVERNADLVSERWIAMRSTTSTAI